MLAAFYWYDRFYGPMDEAFSKGVLVGAFIVILLLCALLWFAHWYQKYEKFKAWKDKKPETINAEFVDPQFVDAQFVETKPRSSNAPQLNSSTAVTKRTSIERRRI